MSNVNLKKQKYFVQGMHCASCEILIEQHLTKNKKIEAVEVSNNKEEIIIDFVEKKLSVGKLNSILSKHGYLISQKPFLKKKTNPKDYFVALVVAHVLMIGFLLLGRSGLVSLANVDAQSAMLSFFVFGVVAGLSSCAALVGGLVLSMSKRWYELNSTTDSFANKIQPHIQFNTGRILSYAIFGGLLGIVGSRLSLSLTFSSFVVILVSMMMILLGFQMLDFGFLSKIKLTLPKSLTKHFSGSRAAKRSPFVLGVLTVFLPCGFTITVQGLALLSGSAIMGATMMLFFVLGTTPTLALIGLSSVKLFENPKLSSQFTKAAGVIVLFFALFNINSQLNVLGLPSVSDLNFQKQKIGNNESVKKESTAKVQNKKSTAVDSKKTKSKNNLPLIIDGKQVITMTAGSRGYKPNSFQVRAGIPVRWEIENVGASGCTNAVIAKDLFEGEIELIPGKISTKEFMPEKVGKYKFSCWMGMVSGVINVVADDQEEIRS